ncbi:hypothetical protein PPSIR1_26543 [Plesiocystis pacifica SIR-1]|uniref:Tetratricopeptide repeat protein n=1 Tax=Plesiocystis pacifica SIR-1 TaxID=391625 RepID=A6GA74_9BACT|nr:hypothetical protein [Plesiocystis pacifica]EDM77176.1 hypothetical protein PPSIR1_26543 [Plesiocystis pacifica SIR-1]
MRRTLTVASFALTATLLSPSASAAPSESDAAAEPAADAPAEDPAEDPALVEAKDLYKQGEIKFRTAEYIDALALWKRAFGILPEGEDTRTIRNALVYNIAEAHSKAYEVNRNPTHLRKAKLLLENYQAEHEALYGDSPEAKKERAEAGERIEELDEKIKASEAAGEQASSIPESEASAGTTEDSVVQAEQEEAGKPSWDEEVKADPVLGPKWATANKRLVGGAVMTGIGGIFGLVALGSFGLVPGSSGLLGGPPVGLIVTGAVTGVIAVGLLVPGGIFLARGIRGRKEVLAAKPRNSAYLVPVPVYVPDTRGAGFGVAVRF